MLHCETSHVTMWATFMTITRWRWRPIAFREKRSVKKYYWITDNTPWKTCTFTCSRVVVVYVVFVVDLFLFVEDFDSCSVIVSIKLIKIRNRTAITYVTYVVHAAQGRSERGCGGASPPPPIIWASWRNRQIIPIRPYESVKLKKWIKTMYYDDNNCIIYNFK